MSQKIQELNKKFAEILDECPDLVFVGEGVLRQKTESASVEEGVKISNTLKNTLASYRKIMGYGRGLAAPQIGENKSVFITFVDDVFKTYINPKITRKSTDCNLYRESCLSCGGLWADVKRSKTISIEYINENNEQIIEDADDFLARLLQHEYDHLQGIVNIDVAESGTIEFMTTDPLLEKLRDCNM